MSRSLTVLNPEFLKIVIVLLRNCTARGSILKPFFTERDPWEQAKLWRRSRSTARVHRAAQEMHDGGAPWLSEVLLGVGPQKTAPRVTGALPGKSWHQWGKAIDCYVSVNGKSVWDANHIGYSVYSEEAIKLGLTSGKLWGDPVHVQLPKSGVIQSLDWSVIEQAMIERYKDV